MTTFNTPEDARAYLLAHDNDVKRWDRMTRAQLVVGVEAIRDGNWIVGGPRTWSKDELINHLASSAYPDTAAAREVYYQSIGA